MKLWISFAKERSRHCVITVSKNGLHDVQSETPESQARQAVGKE